MKKASHYKSAGYLLFLSLIITSCSKQIAIGLNNQSLTGTWSWVSTNGGIANNVHATPASTGKTIEITFTDVKQYVIYTNGMQTAHGTYALSARRCIHDGTDKNVINFSLPGNADMMIEKMDGLHLELADEAYDGVGSSYIRK